MSSNSGTGGGRSTGVSHWGAWQIEEATIKMHVEPMLDVIVNALTIGYLQVRPRRRVLASIVYDTSALRLRPDRSKEAFELYDRGLISGEALLRENGFADDDAAHPGRVPVLAADQGRLRVRHPRAGRGRGPRPRCRPAVTAAASRGRPA